MTEQEKVLEKEPKDQKIGRATIDEAIEGNFVKEQEREEEEKQFNIPTYAIKGNVDERHRMLRKLSFSKEMIAVFDCLCDYAISPAINSPHIELEDFKRYSSNRPEGSPVEEKKFDAISQDVINFLSDDDVQVIKTVAYDSNNKAEKILLLERRKGNLQHEKKIKGFLNKNSKAIKEGRSKFPTLEEMSETLNINSSILENYGEYIPIEKVSLELIESYHHNKGERIFFIFDIGKNLGKIIIPFSSSIEISFFLINLIKNFYKDYKNGELKSFLLKKLEEQNIDPSKIHNLLNSMRIQDPYFIFFTQVFQSIVKNIYEKKKTLNNKLNSVLFNQLVSAIILSQISYNHREAIRKTEEVEEEKQERFKTIFIRMLNYHRSYQTSKIFPPVTYAFVENIRFKKKNNEQEKVAYGKVYKKKDFVDYIRQKNDSKEIFKEFLTFQVEKEIYYLHRIRIISCFLSLTRLERDTVKEKLKKRYKIDKEELFSYSSDEKFSETLAKYISPLYSSLINLILKLLRDSNITITGIKKEDLNYLISRLFLNELEIAHYKNTLPDLCYENFEDKKTLFFTFIRTIFDDFGKVKEFSDMLNLDFYEVKQEVLSEIEVNFLVIIFYNLKDFLIKIGNLFKIEKSEKVLKRTGKKLKKNLTKFKKYFDLSPPPGQLNTNNQKKLENEKRTSHKNGKPSVLIENVPELTDINNLNKKIAASLIQWNDGEDSKKNQEELEKINSLVNKMYNRFDVEEISKKNMDFMFNIIKNNNPYLDDIADQEALKEYLFYKIALLKHQSSH